jgi:histidinol-phosphatase (PHP family)
LEFEEKMKLSGDYHTHSIYCNHAVGELEDYVKEALTKQLPEIGLCDHFPMHLLPETFHHYAMDKSELNSYLNEVQEIKKKFSSDIPVKIGFEVDYMPIVFPRYKDALKPYIHDLDYIIGSVHGVEWKKENLPIDSAFLLPDELLESKEELTIFTNLYYQDLLALVKTDFYDILGHFDVIKKLTPMDNAADSTWDLIFKIIYEIEKNGMIVEVNTSGLRFSERELYPNGEIIKQLIEQKIPLVLGSDAHQPTDVGYEFSSTVKYLKKLGLTHTYQISDHEVSSSPL